MCGWVCVSVFWVLMTLNNLCASLLLHSSLLYCSFIEDLPVDVGAKVRIHMPGRYCDKYNPIGQAYDVDINIHCYNSICNINAFDPSGTHHETPYNYSLGVLHFGPLLHNDMFDSSDSTNLGDGDMAIIYKAWLSIYY